MVNLQIRDVPEALRDRLAATAASRGQSMQSYLMSVLKDEARRSANVELLRAIDALDEGDEFSGAEITAEIAAVRDDRDRRNTEAL
ncbi:FitA-like ribbon-helix-helix domain-containing protein [Glycomyces terrestris]|uniref:Antitoxin FitA-like ribbon-helix-helix domain-containing protein n=1 Tax=Glycomyces terrestris TaxID=2493553 RepID=A0A426V515_9ACTN|nr:hypothetical protein [Glycomyces terrestris]RRS01908.1 hypothetical protein EIW28_03960 [Glycomyces terrestris]